MINEVEWLYNDEDELVVLISPGYGAGWSTWNDPRIAYDKRIVEKFIEEHPSEDEMKKHLESLGYNKVYMGGYDTLCIGTIPRGTWFCIREYDGFESIATIDNMHMIKA